MKTSTGVEDAPAAQSDVFLSSPFTLRSRLTRSPETASNPSDSLQVIKRRIHRVKRIEATFKTSSFSRRAP